MLNFLSFLSPKAHGATRAIHHNLTQARRYSLSHPLASRAVQDLRDTNGWPEAKEENEGGNKGAGPDQAQGENPKRAFLKAQIRVVDARPRNGDFFTISIEPHEWRDPFPPAKKPSSATIVASEKYLSRAGGHTAVEAAEACRNGAYFAVWPVGEDGGNWRSVCTKPLG